jgi:ferredoxin
VILNRKYYFYRNFLSSLLIVLKQFFSLFSNYITGNKDEVFHHSGKGPPLLTIHPDQTLVCTSCGHCQSICPTQCISLTTNEVKKAPTDFVIDMKDCLYCGLCEEVCPDKAIYMAYEVVPIVCGDYDWKWGIDKLAFREGLNRGKGIVLKDGQPQFQNWQSAGDPVQVKE